MDIVRCVSSIEVASYFSNNRFIFRLSDWFFFISTYRRRDTYLLPQELYHFYCFWRGGTPEWWPYCSSLPPSFLTHAGMGLTGASWVRLWEPCSPPAPLQPSILWSCAASGGVPQGDLSFCPQVCRPRETSAPDEEQFSPLSRLRAKQRCFSRLWLGPLIPVGCPFFWKHCPALCRLLKVFSSILLSLCSPAQPRARSRQSFGATWTTAASWIQVGF